MTADVKNLETCFKYLKNGSGETLDDMLSRYGFSTVANDKYARMADAARQISKDEADKNTAVALVPKDLKRSVAQAFDLKIEESMAVFDM